MSPNTLVINCDLRETRVALIEGGVIAELQIERAAHRGTVGNIVLGRVSRVLPGMQAAFIDVGMERAAFLHVEDLIRPDDFEAYLAGDFGEIDKAESGKDTGAEDDESEPLVATTAVVRPSQHPKPPVSVRPPAPSLEPEDDDDDDLGFQDVLEAEDDSDEEDFDSSTGEDEDFDSSAGEDGDLEEERASVDEDEDDDFEDEDDDSEEDDERDDDSEEDDERDDDSEEDDDFEDEDDDERDDDSEEDDDFEDEDDDERDDDFEDEDDDERDDDSGDEAGASDAPVRAEYESEPPAPVSRRGRAARLKPEEEEEEEDRSSRRRRRRRRGSSGGGGSTASGGGSDKSSRKDNRGNKSKSSGQRRSAPAREENSPRDELLAAKRKTSRVSRSVPITDVVKEGDQVVVQISKEPIGTKGARVTSHVSLPGRYCVYLPTVEHVGISKRIGSPAERVRLRKVIEALKPKSGGVIVRTVAAGLTKKALKADLGYLMRLWADVSKRVETARAPSVLYSELDLVLKTARDLFTDDIEKIVIDDKDQYARLVRFVEMFLPERVKDIELYQGDEPIFDAYGIEDEIARALSRKVPLKSGGYLIIDQAEALTAIDVNTGRFVGKGSANLEETALITNLEAVDEIAYQLRFRNVGGLVVLDLIDMEDRRNREKVYRALENALKRDKAKTTINRISELGLIEMTRKRTRESLSRTMHEPCFYCDGTGHIQSRTTIAYEILRQLRREWKTLPGYDIVISAHPAVIDTLQGEERAAVKDAEARYMRRLRLTPRKEYHIEQFDLKGV